MVQLDLNQHSVWCLRIQSTLSSTVSFSWWQHHCFHSPIGIHGWCEQQNQPPMEEARWPSTVAHLSLLVEQASRDSQLWHDIIEAANQQLELTKCKYHVIHFDFKPTGEPQMVVEAQPSQPLLVSNVRGQPVHITHVPSDRALPYLGYQRTPSIKPSKNKFSRRNATHMPAWFIAAS